MAPFVFKWCHLALVGLDRQSSNLIIKDLAKIQELVTLVSSD